MAIRDAHNQYSDSQNLTATGVSTNVIDHGADRNLGQGEPLVVEICVEVAPDAANADETYTVALQTDDAVGFGSPATVGETVTITRGEAAGTKHYIAIPPDTRIERFTRLNYTLGGTTPDLTVSAHLIPASGVEEQTKYPDNITIS